MKHSEKNTAAAENYLGTDSPFRVVLRLAIPSMLAQFVNVLYSIVDRIYIGHMEGVGTTALAGVGICGPLVTLISSFGTWVGLGGAPALSIKMGEKDLAGAKKILSNGILLLAVLSVLLTAAVLRSGLPCSACSAPAGTAPDTPWNIFPCTPRAPCSQ